MAIELPTLYQKNAKGVIEQWRVWSDGPHVFSEHGKLGGKQILHKTLAAATNVGRANQRSPEQQAEFEARAAWTKKQDREGYFATIEDAKTNQVLLPMLAQKFNPKKIHFPATASTKLNGLRLLASVKNGNVTLRSRTGVVWDIPHIEECVKVFAGTDDMMLDGEVYIHGASLQNLNGLVKNTARPERQALQYHLYDLPLFGGHSEKWETRWEMLNGLFHEYEGKVRNETIQLVTQTIVNSEDELKAFEKQAILAGYEGVILRFHGEPYGFNQRPKSMMKIKNFQDSEFEVLSMRSRVHSVNGADTTICDICVCRNNLNDETFEVVPRGSVEQKAIYWRDREQYIGRRLIVRFLERSDDGIPQGNTVGLAFRLDEDASGDDDMWIEE